MNRHTHALGIILLFAAAMTAALYQAPINRTGLLSSYNLQYRELKQEKRAYEAQMLLEQGFRAEPGIEQYIIPRTSGGGPSIRAGMRAAHEHLRSRLSNPALQKAANSSNWLSLGPPNAAGRSRVAIYHPSDPDIMYTGTASGGVFKSTDGGLSWTAKSDFLPTLAIGHMAIDPANPDIVYAGTGEGSDNFDRVYGDGLYKSTDAGETWENIMLTRDRNFEECVNWVELHPESADTIYCAMRAADFGVVKTTDGGQTWNGVLNGTGRIVRVDPNRPERIYAAIGYNRGAAGNGIWISDSNGVLGSFVHADSGLPAPDSIGNVWIDISPSQPGYLVALMSKSYDVNLGDDGYLGSDDFLGLYLSTDYGESWERAPASDQDELQNFMRSQGDYNMYVRFHPEDHNVIYIGGIHNWRSTNYGRTFSQMTD